MNNSFVENGIYNTAAGAIRIVLAILTVPLLVRTLEVQEYGLWTLASSLTGAMSLFDGGFITTTTFFVAQDVGNKDRRALSQTITVTLISVIVLACIGGVGLYLNARIIAGGFPKLDSQQFSVLVTALQISSMVLFFRFLQQVLIAIIQGLQKYKEISLISTLQNILQYIGYIVIAYIGGKTTQLMLWQLTITAFFSIVCGFICVLFLRPWSINYSWDNNRSLSILKYSVIVWFGNLGGILFTQIDKIIVGYFSGTTTLGIYGVITNISSQINTMSATPVQPILPLITEYLVAGELEKVKNQLKKAFQINCLVATGLGTSLILGGNIILPLMLKSEPRDDQLLGYQIGICIYTLYSLNAVGYYISFALGLSKQNMLLTMLSGALSLILIKIGLEHLGLIGGIAGNVGFLITLFLIVSTLKKVGLSITQWLSWVYIPIASFICLSVFTIWFSNLVLLQRLGQLVTLSFMILWSKRVLTGDKHHM